MMCIGWSRPCAYCGVDVCDDEAEWDGFGRPYHPECFGMGPDDDEEAEDYDDD